MSSWQLLMAVPVAIRTGEGRRGRAGAGVLGLERPLFSELENFHYCAKLRRDRVQSDPLVAETSRLEATRYDRGHRVLN